MLAEISDWSTEDFDTAELKDAKLLLDELRAQQIASSDRQASCRIDVLRRAMERMGYLNPGSLLIGCAVCIRQLAPMARSGAQSSKSGATRLARPALLVVGWSSTMLRPIFVVAVSALSRQTEQDLRGDSLKDALQVGCGWREDRLSDRSVGIEGGAGRIIGDLLKKRLADLVA